MSGGPDDGCQAGQKKEGRRLVTPSVLDDGCQVVRVPELLGRGVIRRLSGGLGNVQCV